MSRPRARTIHAGHEWKRSGWVRYQVGRKRPDQSFVEAIDTEPVGPAETARYLVDIRQVRSEPNTGGPPILQVAAVYTDRDLGRWSSRWLSGTLEDGAIVASDPSEYVARVGLPAGDGEKSPPGYQGLGQSELLAQYREVLQEAHGLDLPDLVADGGRHAYRRECVDAVRQEAGVADDGPCPHGNPECPGPFAEGQLPCADCFLDEVDGDEDEERLVADGGREQSSEETKHTFGSGSHAAQLRCCSYAKFRVGAEGPSNHYRDAFHQVAPENQCSTDERNRLRVAGACCSGSDKQQRSQVSTKHPLRQIALSQAPYEILPASTCFNYNLITSDGTAVHRLLFSPRRQKSIPGIESLKLPYCAMWRISGGRVRGGELT